ncbi:MAG: hypothetical protein AUK38_01495 [Nitrospirae bacterium CG2_30_41_42]|nr:MAG: hypothetical protein AUK38_01495 [Nitrospirae bacterium CG2_30_41_42]
MNSSAADCEVSGLSFWLVQNLSVSKKDSRQAGMTQRNIFTPKPSFKEFFDLSSIRSLKDIKNRVLIRRCLIRIILHNISYRTYAMNRRC